MGIVFGNFAAARLAAAIDAEAAQIIVHSAAALPSLGSDGYFYAVLVGAEALREVVRVTAIDGNVLTVTRGQDQTEARAYKAGDVFELRLTRGGVADWLREVIAEVAAQTEDMLAVAEPEIRAICRTSITTFIDARIPVGTVFCSMLEEPPECYSNLDGAPLSRTDCPGLFSLWGSAFGDGDGSTTFGKPDARGRFLRFYDGDGDVDPDKAARSGDGGPGSVQADDCVSHRHPLKIGRQWVAEGGAWAYGYANHGETDATLLRPAGGTETRPKNVSMVPVVRIKDMES